MKPVMTHVMKHVILFTSCACLLLLSSGVGAAKLNSDEKKLSYALGVLLANGVIQQKLEVDTDAFVAAVRDVLDKNDLKLSQQEIQKLITQFQQKQSEAETMATNTNKAEGEKFLAENKKKKGITVLDNGLQYKIITEGKGRKPKADNVVKVHYRGTLIDGTEFDSSYSRGQPAEFPINGVIQGWQEILPRMPTGSKWQVFIPSDLAYGERGAGGLIGAHATLIFEIELLEIK